MEDNTNPCDRAMWLFCWIYATRQIGESRFTLTVKRGVGLVREEWEKNILEQGFESLAERLMSRTMIEKRRYRLPLNGLTVEVHIYSGYLEGFSYVEVEFPTTEEAAEFTPPAWFGRELTDDARFSYGTLAWEDGMKIVQRILA